MPNLTVILFSGAGAIALTGWVIVPAVGRLLRRRRENALPPPPSDAINVLRENDRWLVDLFKNHSVVIAGETGTGKDAIFSHVSGLRGEKHYCKTKYSDLTETEWNYEDLNIGGNTFENFKTGKFKKFKRRFERYCDVYIPDAGVIFPNYENTRLEGEYPELPFLMFLQRQLYDMHIHFNLTVGDRFWIKLRAHIQHFIVVFNKESFRGGLKLITRYYSRASSAEENLLPPNHLTGRALAQYTATHGEIIDKIFYIPPKHLEYDTHAFGTLLLDESEDTSLPKKRVPFIEEELLRDMNEAPGDKDYFTPGAETETDEEVDYLGPKSTKK